MRGRKAYYVDMSKIIVLASLWKRSFAHLLDLFLSLALFAAVYMSAVFPFAIDHEAYANNQNEMVMRLLESGLYLEYDGAALDPMSNGMMSKVEDFSSYTIYYQQVGKEFHFVDALHDFYLTKSESFGGNNLSEETFLSTILKAGSEESNIAGYTKEEDGYLHLDLIDPKEESTAFLFFRASYKDALSSLNNDALLKKLDAANRGIALVAVLYALPVLFGSSLIVVLLPSLLFPNGQTIGKKAFKLVVLTKDGYAYPKGMLVWRFFAYFITEVLLTVVTFGASLLVSYTMTMFTKKHRSIHDYLAGSVVASEEDSLWFKNALEEELFDEENKREDNA